MFKLPDFPAYYTLLDKLGWLALRAGGLAVLAFHRIVGSRSAPKSVPYGSRLMGQGLRSVTKPF